MTRYLSSFKEGMRLRLENLHYDNLDSWKIISLFVVAVICFSGIILYLSDPETRVQYFDGLFVELGGFLLDLAFLGIFIGWFENRRNTRQEIRRYQEEIDDYKKWDSREARCRIAGNIRRLAKHGFISIDFTGILLTDFCFAENDITSIKGAHFHDGLWGKTSLRERTSLTRVSFLSTDCRDVTFCHFNPFIAFAINNPYVVMEDCTFIRTDLRGAKFNGAHLRWTEPAGREMYETDQDEHGEWYHFQVYEPPFYEANLQGASFDGCHFDNADFRGAENITDADFSRTSGLETCVFDEADAEALRKKGWLK